MLYGTELDSFHTMFPVYYEMPLGRLKWDTLCESEIY